MKKHGGNRKEIEREYGIESHCLLDFSANINPLGLSPRIRKMIEATIEELIHYPDSEYQELKTAIAEHHQLATCQILPGNGEAELIYLLAASLQATKVLLLAPTFSEYEEAFNIAGSQVEFLELSESDGFKTDVDQLIESLIKRPTIDCVCLCNPNNPTGQLIPKKSLLKLLQYCYDNNVSLVMDEAFIDFISANLERSLVTEIQHNQHLYILRSLTKFYAIPGLRLGYVISSNPTVINKMKAQQIPWSINSFAAAVGEELLTDLEYGEATLRLVAEQRGVLEKQMSAITRLKLYPSSCNYILFKVDGISRLREKLLAKKILIRSCANYRGLDDTYYRIAVKNKQDNQFFLDALRAVIASE